MKAVRFSYVQWLDCVSAVRLFALSFARHFRIWLLALFIVWCVLSLALFGLNEVVLLITLILLLIVGRFSRILPEEGGPLRPGARKPVPRGPNPKPLLVAAKDLPPSEKTYLFPKN